MPKTYDIQMTVADMFGTGQLVACEDVIMHGGRLYRADPVWRARYDASVALHGVNVVHQMFGYWVKRHTRWETIKEVSAQDDCMFRNYSKLRPK